MVVADAGRFPTRVVAAGIGLIELVPKVTIPTDVQKTHTKRSFSWKIERLLEQKKQKADNHCDQLGILGKPDLTMGLMTLCS